MVCANFRIESKILKDSDAFDEMVCSNPRYIINTSGDTPAIVVEGCRYNALHIAARVGNLHVVRYVIDAVRDIRALAKIYGSVFQVSFF